MPGSLDGLKARLIDASATARRLRRDLRNSKLREQCAKEKLTNLQTELRESHLLNEGLKERLDGCSGKMKMLLQRHFISQVSGLQHGVRDPRAVVLKLFHVKDPQIDPYKPADPHLKRYAKMFTALAVILNHFHFMDPQFDQK